MKRLIDFIKHLGYCNTVLVTTLTLASVTLLLMTFTSLVPQLKNDDIVNIALVTIMTCLTILLVLFAQEQHKNSLDTGIQKSGILSVVDGMARAQIERVFDQNEKTIVLNTWINNLSEITPSLTNALSKKEFGIDFYLLSSERDFVQYRSSELGRDARQAITNCHQEMSFLLKNLTEQEVKKVRGFYV